MVEIDESINHSSVIDPPDRKSGSSRLLRNASLFIVLLVAIWPAWFVLFSGELLRFHYHNVTNRERLTSVRDGLKIGDRYERVLNVFWNVASNSELQLRANHKDCFIVRMPSEILATDWIMYLSFEANSLSGIYVRSSDGPKTNTMPADIGSGGGCKLEVSK
jgi:hypothetical protein